MIQIESWIESTQITNRLDSNGEQSGSTELYKQIISKQMNLIEIQMKLIKNKGIGIQISLET